MISTTPQLDAAIDQAAAAAKSLVASECGGRSRRRPGDPAESWWYYPPSEAVQAEAERVMALAGLSLDLISQTMGARGQCCVTWRLRHTSGEHRDLVWEAPPMPDLETPAHGVLGSVRHSQRCIYLTALRLRVVAYRETSATETTTAHPPAGGEEFDAVTGELPGWADASTPPPQRMDPAKVAALADHLTRPKPVVAPIEPPSAAETPDLVLWGLVKLAAQRLGCTVDELRTRSGCPRGRLAGADRQRFVAWLQEAT